MGSFERFIGILIEHYAGEFPVWLAPVQAIVLPISDRHVDAARDVAAELRRAPASASRSTSAPESIGRRIRDAELRKIPYMLVIGDREAAGGHGRRAPSPRGRHRDAASSIASPRTSTVRSRLDVTPSWSVSDRRARRWSS